MSYLAILIDIGERIEMNNGTPIKNIIFDIGNVMVKWSPIDIIKLTFDEDSDIEYHVKNLFKHNTWIQLNANETLFIDDHLPNVNAARELNINGTQFINIDQCIDELESYQIRGIAF